MEGTKVLSDELHASLSPEEQTKLASSDLPSDEGRRGPTTPPKGRTTPPPSK